MQSRQGSADLQDPLTDGFLERQAVRAAQGAKGWLDRGLKVPFPGPIAPLLPFLGGEVAPAALLQWGMLALAYACKMGCSAPPSWLASQIGECEKPCAATAAVPRRVCRQRSCGHPPSCPSISKYSCSHFPLIDIKKQLRIKLFKLIGLLNLKHFSLFGWYHCLD